MDSLILDNNSVEIMEIQHRTIALCMKAIFDKIADDTQSCTHIGALLDQLEILCQDKFRFIEQLLEDVNYPSAAEQKRLHGLYLDAINLFKVENEECHTANFLKKFVNLRLEYALNMNQETIMLCDYLLKMK